jgi:hypothetical protein
MSAYTAEPGSASQDALKLLATWTATLDRSDARIDVDDVAQHRER